MTERITQVPSTAPMPIPTFAPILSPDDDDDDDDDDDVELEPLVGAEADIVIVTGLNGLDEVFCRRLCVTVKALTMVVGAAMRPMSAAVTVRDGPTIVAGVVERWMLITCGVRSVIIWSRPRKLANSYRMCLSRVNRHLAHQIGMTDTHLDWAIDCNQGWLRTQQKLELSHGPHGGSWPYYLFWRDNIIDLESKCEVKEPVVPQAGRFQ